MRPLLPSLRYFLDDAWDECRHSPGVNALAVATLAAALFMAGVVLLVLSNLGARVEHLRDDVRVEVYLRDGTDDATRALLEGRLRQIDGVAEIEYVDKTEALRRFRESFGDLADLPAELGSNPLPASLEVVLEPGPGAPDVARSIVESATGAPGVEEARFDQGWLDRLQDLLGLARLGGAALAVLVFAAVVFVMASVLRLAVYARRDEIEIMLLVGATPSFVRGPFLVAGIGQGIVASVVAVVLVEVSRRFALAYSDAGPLALVDLVAGRPLPVDFAGLLLLTGLLVGLAGAFFAVRRSV